MIYQTKILDCCATPSWSKESVGQENHKSLIMNHRSKINNHRYKIPDPKYQIQKNGSKIRSQMLKTYAAAAVLVVGCLDYLQKRKRLIWLRFEQWKPRWWWRCIVMKKPPPAGIGIRDFFILYGAWLGYGKHLSHIFYLCLSQSLHKQ